MEFFVGRSAEIEQLRALIRRSAGGRFSIGYVSGERGIGKSSLAAFVRHLVERDNDAVGCHVMLGGVRSLPGMLRQTLDRVLKESIGRPWHQQVVDFFGDRARRVGVFGVTLELRLEGDDLERMERDFIVTIRRLVERLDAHGKSLFLILDDINGLAGSDRFANWLKSTVDEIAVSRPGTSLCILVVGLEERRQELIAVQPSLARVFDLIHIAPWTDAEVADFYRRAFREGGARLPENGLRTLTLYTGGLPVLAHEIGHAVWRVAAGSEIDAQAVTGGIILAAEVIGGKLLEPRIFNAIRSARYRAMLRRIADRPSRLRFTRAEVLKGLPSADKGSLDNFLRRMRKLGALEVDPEAQGGYRFPNRLHALYFYMESRAHGVDGRAGRQPVAGPRAGSRFTPGERRSKGSGRR